MNKVDSICVEKKQTCYRCDGKLDSTNVYESRGSMKASRRQGGVSKIRSVILLPSFLPAILRQSTSRSMKLISVQHANDTRLRPDADRPKLVDDGGGRARRTENECDKRMFSWLTNLS